MVKRKSVPLLDLDDDPEVSEELIQATCDLLGLLGGPGRADTARELRLVAVDYLIDLSLEPLSATPKQQRAAMRQLLKWLDGTLAAMRGIAPEYAVALDGLADRDRRDAPRSIFDEAWDRIFELANLVDRFDTAFQPNKGRPADVPLESALRRLIDLVEPLMGEFPKVQLNKHKGESPTLKSTGARAIGHLLGGVHPGLDEATIARMIEKIRRQPWQSETHFEALFRLDPNFELDCSLLGNRARH
jgi:hypothetical protein